MPTKKPYAGCPLFLHNNGQWCKKIKGKLVYFGTVQSKALAKFLNERDYHYAGVRPPTDEPTVADLLDRFLGGKVRAVDSGEISKVTFEEYESTCDVLAAWGKLRQLSKLGAVDFQNLREALGQGKTKSLSPVTLKRRVGIARMILKSARKLGVTIDYEDELHAPPARVLRQIKNSKIRLYKSEQVRSIVANAKGELQGMILLGINCGFGPQDCCDLPSNRVDLDNGWHNFHREKTGVERRCPLWPETVAALRKCSNENGKLFDVTWTRRNIAYHFRQLVDSFYVKDVTEFYSLRRTFETMATTSGVPQAVIDAIMGHVAKADDMSATYRQMIFSEQLLQCSNHVRKWYQGKLPNLDTF